MAKEKFEDRRLTGDFNIACKFDDGTTRYWTDKKENVVKHIVQITREYAAQGYVLTLRQLHYQLVSNNWIVNHDTAYSKLGNILDDCRYAGIIDWDMIEDRGRKPHLVYAVDSVTQALEETLDYYRRNRQEGQTNHVELWSEKDALSGIFKRTTEKYHIRLVVNKGYTSSSAIYQAYERYCETLTKGDKVTILYFGDHDPSGLDMIRDIRERLELFFTHGDQLKDSAFDQLVNTWWTENEYNIYNLTDDDYLSPKDYDKIMNGDDYFGDEFRIAQYKMYFSEKEIFKVIPIGLTMDQIKTYKLPPNPTKLTDSRSQAYIKKYGKTCWEVDALRPQTLTDIVEANIQVQIDIPAYEKMLKQEKSDKDTLKKLIKKV